MCIFFVALPNIFLTKSRCIPLRKPGILKTRAQSLFMYFWGERIFGSVSWERTSQSYFLFRSFLWLPRASMESSLSCSFQSLWTQIVTGWEPRYIRMKFLEKTTSPCPAMDVHKWLHFVTALGDKKANAFENGKCTWVSSCTCVSVVLDSGKKNRLSRHARIWDTDKKILVVPRTTRLFVVL